MTHLRFYRPERRIKLLVAFRYANSISTLN
jgi:hypothetical protein